MIEVRTVANSMFSASILLVFTAGSAVGAPMTIYDRPVRLAVRALAFPDAVKSVCRQILVDCRVEHDPFQGKPITLIASEKMDFARALDALALIGDSAYERTPLIAPDLSARVVFRKAPAVSASSSDPLNQLIKLDIAAGPFSRAVLGLCKEARIGCVVDYGFRTPPFQPPYQSPSYIQCKDSGRESSDCLNEIGEKGKPIYEISLPESVPALKAVQILTVLSDRAYRVRTPFLGTGAFAPPTIIFGVREQVPVILVSPPKNHFI